MGYLKPFYFIALKAFYYIAREIKKFCEFFLIPFLVVLLPHRVYYPIFKLICRHSFFYAMYTDKSYINAQRYLNQTNPEVIWNRNVKLLNLVDIADMWLAWLRPQKARKLLHKNGSWSKNESFIALSSHWGTGFTSLAHLNESGLKPFFVFAKQEVEFKYQSIVERYYRKLRHKYFDKISGSIAIPTGKAYQMIKKKVEEHGIPVILFDATRPKKQAKYSLKIVGCDYYISSGFIKLICKENIPYQLFAVHMDFDTGVRNLTINSIKRQDSEQELVHELSKTLNDCINQSPELWFFWNQANQFFYRSNKEDKNE